MLIDVQERCIADLVLTGDLGVQASQSWMLDAVALYQMNPLVVMGNHDKWQDFQTLTFLISALEGQRPVLFRCSQRCSLHLSGFQPCLIDQEQLAIPTEDVVVFIHHPILDCGQTTMDRLYPLENRETLQRILFLAGCNVTVFCGHYHTEQEQ